MGKKENIEFLGKPTGAGNLLEAIVWIAAKPMVAVDGGVCEEYRRRGKLTRKSKAFLAALLGNVWLGWDFWKETGQIFRETNALMNTQTVQPMEALYTSAAIWGAFHFSLWTIDSFSVTEQFFQPLSRSKIFFKGFYTNAQS
jgi:hypothetical protein